MRHLPLARASSLIRKIDAHKPRSDPAHKQNDQRFRRREVLTNVWAKTCECREHNGSTNDEHERSEGRLLG
jgi:hypothetical protein